MIGMFRYLLPTGKAWRLTINKQLRQFFEGLTWLQTDVKTYTDSAYTDMFPQTTRLLDELEAEYGYLPGSLTEQERRDRLSARMASVGGQSPKYLQNTLQAAGFNVYIHEWWSDDTPTARNPNEFLVNVGTLGWTLGNPYFTLGNPAATLGGGGGNGTVLVNKIVTTVPEFPNTLGNPAFTLGGATSTLGYFTSYAPKAKEYPIPNDPSLWPHFLYFGAETFPELAQVPADRRDEFETLLLRICPAHLWLGLLIQYT